MKYLIAFASFLGLLLAGHAASGAEVTRPNIVFILADDLGWADTTLYGQTKYYRTPNLERLAQRGVTFMRAYSASPLCSPTRASILTGQNPARIGITAPTCHVPEVRLTASIRPTANANAKSLICDSATRFNTNYVTLAERLKAAGYATGHFGKWHLGPEPYSPLQQGFDVDVPHWAGPGPAGSYVAPWKFKDFDADPGEPNQHIEDRMAKEAVKFMEQHKDGPFFLNYWMFSVHAPFDAKKSLIEKYRRRTDPQDAQRSPTYAAMVESMDDAVGTLLDTLDRLGIADKTAVVFYADNGGNMYNEIDGTTPTSNRPLRGGKATMWEGGIRVPAIVNWPGLTKAGTRSEAMIQSTDFYPTILSLLKLSPTPNHPIDGVNIVSALRGDAFERGAMFTYFPHQTKVPDWLPPSVSVHRGDWKLIRLLHQGEDGAHAYELHNLREDQGETNNLAKGQPALVKELDALIEKFLADTKAVVPGRNPAYDPRAKSGPTDTKKAKQAAAGNSSIPGWSTSRFAALSVSGEEWQIVSTGNDPWVATRDLPAKAKGPFTLRFKMKSNATGEGRVYYTDAVKPGFNKEQSVALTMQHDGEWHDYKVELPAEKLTGLRLDPASGKGEIRIGSLELRDAAGKLVKAWKHK
jgi:arylsulfatase A-like enzyme